MHYSSLTLAFCLIVCLSFSGLAGFARLCPGDQYEVSYLFNIHHFYVSERNPIYTSVIFSMATNLKNPSTSFFTRAGLSPKTHLPVPCSYQRDGT